MAITDNYAPIKTLGNGVTTAFSTNNWSPLVAEYLLVFLESVATGVQTLQVLDVDYTFAFTGTGFTVTFISGAPTSANYVVIGREVALDQTAPYKTSRGWQGDVVEDSFDKLTAMAQDSKDSENRSPKYALASGKTGTIGNPVDGAVLVFSGTDGDITDGPTVAQISSAEQDAIDAAASAAAAAASAATISEFDLSGTPAANDGILWDTGAAKFVRKTIAQLRTALGIPFTTASAAGPASLEFAEDTDNGTNKTTLSGAAAQTADRAILLPDADGTVILDSPAQNISGIKTFTAAPVIVGRTDGAPAAAGNVGQVTTGTLAVGSATSLTTGTAKTVTSISLTAGKWSVSGVVQYVTAGTTNTTLADASISQTNNAMGTLGQLGYGRKNGQGVINQGDAIQTGPMILDLSVTTTVYLVALSNFTVSTTTAYGQIQAVRIQG